MAKSLIRQESNLVLDCFIQRFWPFVNSKRSCLQKINHWGQLNVVNCQVITFSGGRSQLITTYTFNGVELSRTTEEPDLVSVLLTQVDHAIMKCRFSLGLVKRSSHDFNDSKVAKSLYCSLVRSVLDMDGHPVWSPYHTVHIARLESIQKQFMLWVDKLSLALTRFILNLRPFQVSGLI